jgi:hypothetical protein
MPFLIGLTTEERKSLLTMDVANKAFSEDAITAAINNPTLVPGYINLSSLQNDLTLFSQLDEIMGLANQLCERIDDTKMLAGSEVYQASLALYSAFGTAASAGVPGVDAIVDQLKNRFKRTKTATEAITVPPAPLQ